MARRYYSSTAARTTLASGVDGSTVTLSVTAVSGWPTQYPYTLILDKDTVNEELVSVSARSGTTLTVTRGVDGTSGTAHSAGATVEHGVSARDFDEPNDHVNASSAVHGLSGTVVGTTDTQTLTNKTLTTPTIASFANATHDHEDAAGGGTITVAAISDIAANYFPLNVATNEETASYTLVLGDAQKIVEMNVATANTLTIPTNASVAFPVGTSILVVQTGAGQTTIAGAAGVTVNSYLGLKIAGQWAAATLVKRATNTWVAVGALVA
jgi:hypothetical protein